MDLCNGQIVSILNQHPNHQSHEGLSVNTNMFYDFFLASSPLSSSLSSSPSFSNNDKTNSNETLFKCASSVASNIKFIFDVTTHDEMNEEVVVSVDGDYDRNKSRLDNLFIIMSSNSSSSSSLITSLTSPSPSPSSSSFVYITSLQEDSFVTIEIQLLTDKEKLLDHKKPIFKSIYLSSHGKISFTVDSGR